MYKIVVHRSPSAGGIQPTNYDLEKEALAQLDVEIREIVSEDEDEFIAEARDADAVYVHRVFLTRRAIESLESCKVISTGSVGVDKIDVGAATERGIPVTNVPDVFIEEVADHTMALILSTYRRVTLMDSMARDERWSQGRAVLYAFPRLFGMTLGLISFGNIARAVAHRAAPFGLRILAHDPYLSELAMTKAGVEPVGLTELLQRSDIVSMHAPATRETHHMMGEEQFRLMSPQSIFINTSRGDTVDEEALIRALDEKWIGAAGLDVLGKGAARPRQSDPQDGQRHPLAARRLGIGAYGAGASPPGRTGARARAARPLAPGLCEPFGASGVRSVALEAVFDGVTCDAAYRRISGAARDLQRRGRNPVRP